MTTREVARSASEESKLPSFRPSGFASETTVAHGAASRTVLGLRNRHTETRSHFVGFGRHTSCGGSRNDFKMQPAPQTMRSPEDVIFILILLLRCMLLTPSESSPRPCGALCLALDTVSSSKSHSLKKVMIKHLSEQVLHSVTYLLLRRPISCDQRE